MGRFALLLLAVTGCSQLFGLDSPQRLDGAAGDAAADVTVLDGDGCFGQAHICLDAVPPDRTFGTSTINTADGCDAVYPQANGAPDLCMMVGNAVRITGTLKATGPRPLLIAALGTLSIETSGTIDVASRNNQAAGAGANPAECVDGMDGANSSGADAGGGAGASFQGKGGDGGSGDVSGGAAAPASVIAPTHVRGGCKGRRGGVANGALPYDGGDGGGAVLLVAGTRIEIAGDINASGGGGKGGAIGGNGNSGGSGGGSGGLIWLDAPVIEISGDVFANGGGGGGASSSVLPGGTGTTSSDPAVGGAGAGSSGGDGGALADMNGTPGTSAATGGGGGGGGGGFVQAFSNQVTITGSISPPIR